MIKNKNNKKMMGLRMSFVELKSDLYKIYPIAYNAHYAQNIYILIFLTILKYI